MTRVVAIALANPEVRLGKERVVGKVISADLDDDGTVVASIEITDDDFYQALSRGARYSTRISVDADPARRKI